LKDDVFADGMVTFARAAALRRQFVGASPFPHVVIDGLFDPAFLDEICADFRVGLGDWMHYRSTMHTKRATRPNAPLRPASRAYFDAIHRGSFTQFLTAITGIEGLLPDPTLFAGGLHEIPSGGCFGVHIDFNKHPVTRLDNRLVFITYLNKDWLPEYGGALQLVDGDGTTVNEVEPIFGRSILFAHSKASRHGHPDPVAAPDDRPRRSLAAYFYTNGVDETETAHTTQFLEAPRFGPWGRAIALANYVSPMLVDVARFAYRRGIRAIRSPSR
jgi:hypothetical protein